MSKPIFENLASIQERLAAASHLLLGLDFDGTLAPHVDDPSQAQLSVEMKEVVQTIAAQTHVSVAIVSGRHLHDVRARVDIEGLIYAGNHGLEICGPGFSFLEPTAEKTQRTIGWLASALAKNLSQVTGVIVENKSLTISVHCRQVAALERETVHRHVQAAVGVAPGVFRVAPGNYAFDVGPQVEWHKGSAICWIAKQLQKQNSLTLFLGDDRSDEDAFLALGDGITVKIGDPGDTAAQYYLEGPACVLKFLSWLATLQRH